MLRITIDLIIIVFNTTIMILKKFLYIFLQVKMKILPLRAQNLDDGPLFALEK